MIRIKSDLYGVRKGNKEHVRVCVLSHCSHVRLCETLWAAACQAPLSLGFSRQEYWSGLPFPPPGDFLYPGIEPVSSALQVDSLPLAPPGKPNKHAADGQIRLAKTLASCVHLL